MALIAQPHAFTPKVHLPRVFARGATAMTALIPNGPVEAGGASYYLTRGRDGVDPRALLTESGALPLTDALMGQRRRIEEGTTNHIFNPRGLGTPQGNGLPPLWAFYDPGAIATAVQTDAGDGFNYVDVTVDNTTGVGQQVNVDLVDTASAPAASVGETWTCSVALALIAGSIPAGVVVRLSLAQQDASHVFLFGLPGPDIRAELSSSLKTFTWTATVSSASTAFLLPEFVIGPGSTIPDGASFTLRFYKPQFEQKDYATSYCDGSLGTGYSWSGTAHASTSTRAASRVSASAGMLDETQAALAMWWRPSLDSGQADNPYGRLFTWRDDDDNRLSLVYNRGLTQFDFERRALGISTGTGVDDGGYTAGDDLFFYCGWDAGGVEISLNAGAKAPVAGGNIPNLAATTFDIGSQDGSVRHINGAYGPVYLFDRPLTQPEIEFLYESRWVPMGAVA